MAAIVVVFVGVLIATNWRLGSDSPSDLASGSDLDGAPASRLLRFDGVTYLSENNAGVSVRIRSTEMKRQKRSLGFFSVAFLWELVLVNGEIRGEMNPDSCASDPTHGPCEVSQAWREFVIELAQFGERASRVRVESLLLDFLSAGATVLEIRSQDATIDPASGIELSGEVMLRVGRQTLETERMTLRPDGALVVEGHYVMQIGHSPPSGTSIEPGADGVFWLTGEGRLELEEPATFAPRGKRSEQPDPER